MEEDESRYSHEYSIPGGYKMDHFNSVNRYLYFPRTKGPGLLVLPFFILCRNMPDCGVFNYHRPSAKKPAYPFCNRMHHAVCFTYGKSFCINDFRKICPLDYTSYNRGFLIEYSRIEQQGYSQ